MREKNLRYTTPTWFSARAVVLGGILSARPVFLGVYGYHTTFLYHHNLKSSNGNFALFQDNYKLDYQKCPSKCPTDKIKGVSYFSFVWSERNDSNVRPPAPKAGALPGCATLREFLFIRHRLLISKLFFVFFKTTRPNRIIFKLMT